MMLLLERVGELTVRKWQPLLQLDLEGVRGRLARTHSHTHKHMNTLAQTYTNVCSVTH